MTGDRALAIAILAAVCLTLSCSDSSGPSGTVSAFVNDPAGDQFGTDSVRPDLVKLTVTRDAGGIDVVLDFAANAISLLTDTIHGVGGLVDFDVDQDSTTGLVTWTDIFGGSSGMGEEYYLQFLDYQLDSTVSVHDSNGTLTGSVRPVFSGKRVSFRILKTMLGNDDGFMNVAVVVGNNIGPTDLAPDTGHLKVGGTGAVAAYRPAAGLRSLPVGKWGGRWSVRR
jgi:hypothetical protein